MMYLLAQWRTAECYLTGYGESLTLAQSGVRIPPYCPSCACFVLDGKYGGTRLKVAVCTSRQEKPTVPPGRGSAD